MTASDPSSPPLGRRERKKRETRQRIRREAARLFTAHGFEATTVEEIAEAADVSRATFFNYYPEKSALAADLGEGMTEVFLAALEEVRGRDVSTQERLVELLMGSARRIGERRDLSRVLLFETVARRRDLDERRSHTLRLHDGIGALLRDGIQRGDVRSDVPLSLLAEMVSGAYTEILLTWLIDSGYPLEDHLQRAAHFLGSALAPPPDDPSRRKPRTPGARTRRRSA